MAFISNHEIVMVIMDIYEQLFVFNCNYGLFFTIVINQSRNMLGTKGRRTNIYGPRSFENE